MRFLRPGRRPRRSWRIATLGPFGVGAPEPVFLLQDVSITGLRRIGVNHLRFIAEDASGRIDCVAWRAEDQPIGQVLRQGGRFSLVGRLKCDTWNGRERVQLEIADVAALQANWINRRQVGCAP